jgi:hypothetical protein
MWSEVTIAQKGVRTVTCLRIVTQKSFQRLEPIVSIVAQQSDFVLLVASNRTKKKRRTQTWTGSYAVLHSTSITKVSRFVSVYCNNLNLLWNQIIYVHSADVSNVKVCGTDS